MLLQASVLFFLTMIIISHISPWHSLPPFSSLFVCLFTPALQRPPIGNCRISFVFSCFYYPNPFIFLLLCSFFPSCSLASFNHPVLLWESRLCSSTKGPERLLIIPQHVSHLHKHVAKNKPFPCQPPYTLEAKIFPLVYEDALLVYASPYFLK